MRCRIIDLVRPQSHAARYNAEATVLNVYKQYLLNYTFLARSA
jgi:hypothetical protein